MLQALATRRTEMWKQKKEVFPSERPLGPLRAFGIRFPNCKGYCNPDCVSFTAQ